jgi:TRAP-type C4-dicarboxylate transport system substrate-binding protein
MRKTIFVLLMLSVSAAANAVQLKIATLAPANSEWAQAMQAGAKEISERTASRVQIKFRFSQVEGSDETVIRKMRIGSLQGGVFTPSAVHDLYRDINLYGLPLVFNSYDEANYVRARMDQTLIDGLDKAGYVTFGFAATGFAMLMSNKPIRNLDDIKGKKVWVPQGDPISYKTMQALGVTPQTHPLADVYVGLQTKLFDVVPVSPIGAIVMQWHTKVKYLTDIPLVYTYGFMIIDKRAFTKISDPDQAIVREVMTRIYSKFDMKNVVDDAKAKQALFDSGIKRVVPDKEAFARIRSVLAKSNRQMAAEGVVSEDLFNEMMRYLAQYRKENDSEAGDEADTAAPNST